MLRKAVRFLPPLSLTVGPAVLLGSFFAATGREEESDEGNRNVCLSQRLHLTSSKLAVRGRLTRERLFFVE